MPHAQNTPTTLDACRGCLLGLALGDTLGAPYEGGWLERGLWAVLGRTPDGLRRWTDDTQMAMDLAESLLACQRLDQDDLAQRFAQSYRWRRGYGPGAAKVLRRIRRGEHWSRANTYAHRQGSWGNGAAMRAAVLALWPFQTMDALAAAARQSAIVTHAHPQGMDGAVLIAVAARALLQRQPANQALDSVAAQAQEAVFQPLLHQAADWLRRGACPAPREVARTLGNGMTARTSCVTALYIALRHMPQKFDDLLEFAVACGGDVDTIAAMSGALWGIHHGAAALPAIALEQQDRLEMLACQLHAATP